MELHYGTIKPNGAPSISDGTERERSRSNIPYFNPGRFTYFQQCEPLARRSPYFLEASYVRNNTNLIIGSIELRSTECAATQLSLGVDTLLYTR